MIATPPRPARMLYIPYMSDHSHVLAAALRAHGLSTEVLPPPDAETLSLGLDLCKGRECLPCFTCIGDIVRRSRSPGFEPSRAALFMPTTAGPCRFGQYHSLYRDILDRHGLRSMEIVSPTAANSYHGFGDNPGKLRTLFWQGVVAVDLLQSLLHQYRPYEIHDGESDQAYHDCLAAVASATRAGGGDQLRHAMKLAAARFGALRVESIGSRPVIGVVGEIFLRFNAYSNQGIVRRVEAAGGQVQVASLMEWFYFTNWGVMAYSRYLRRHRAFFSISLVDLYQRRQMRRLTRPVEHLLPHGRESSINHLIKGIRPYYEPLLGTEAVLSMGKAIEFARKGLSGILNIMPFSCMPGIITAAMAPHLRAHLNNIPWLDIVYDAQESTNINTRLEAFMYQAIQFKRRSAKTCPGGRSQAAAGDRSL